MMKRKLPTTEPLLTTAAEIEAKTVRVNAEAAAPPCSEPWHGTAAAAKHLGTSIPTFRRWIKQGLVPAKRTPTGELRFRLSDLDKLIQ